MAGIDKLLAKENAETTAAKCTLIAEKLTAHGNPCTRQVIEHWVRQKRVPGKWALPVNRVYRIPLHELLSREVA
jgi:hypothetical protein